MAFKSFSQYQEDKNGDFFVLPNNGDSAEVVFLYKSPDDVLVGDVHYLNTASYKGYVHCCGKGCPACNYGERGIRVDHKIFIPLYNIQKNKIEFWDRTTFFEQVLQEKVFRPFPNPSEAVFRITRNGAAGDRNTKYEIDPIGRNVSVPYESILAGFNVTFPDGYSKICKEMTADEMYKALNTSTSTTDLQDYGYVPVPRVAPAADVPVPDMPTIPIPDYNPVSVGSPIEGDAVLDALNLPVPDDSEDNLDDVKF